MQAHPLGGQVDRKLPRSAPFGTEEQGHIKGGFALAQVIDRPAHLMRPDAQGFAFVLFFLQAGQIFLSRFVVTPAQGSRVGKGPLEVRMADFLA